MIDLRITGLFGLIILFLDIYLGHRSARTEFSRRGRQNALGTGYFIHARSRADTVVSARPQGLITPTSNQTDTASQRNE